MMPGLRCLTSKVSYEQTPNIQPDISHEIKFLLTNQKALESFQAPLEYSLLIVLALPVFVELHH